MTGKHFWLVGWFAPSLSFVTANLLMAFVASKNLHNCETERVGEWLGASQRVYQIVRNVEFTLDDTRFNIYWRRFVRTGWAGGDFIWIPVHQLFYFRSNANGFQLAFVHPQKSRESHHIGRCQYNWLDVKWHEIFIEV